MRFYTVTVSNADGSGAFVPSSTPGQAAQWSSMFVGTGSNGLVNLAGGGNNLSALKVEFDVFSAFLGAPVQASTVKIWGVPLELISQATDFIGKIIDVSAGMSPGLPLASAAYNNGQQGPILHGVIWSSYGNWVMTEQWIQFVVLPDPNQVNETLNIVFQQQRGTSLQQAITQTLQNAAPGYSVVGSISSNLVVPETQTSFHGSLSEFGQFIKDMSTGLGGGNYKGVDIWLSPDKTFHLSDSTTSSSGVKQIKAQDLVSQPVWVDVGQIQVATVLRADITLSDIIQLPQTPVTIAPATPFTPLRDKSIFNGTFQVVNVHHVGDSRGDGPLAWVTTFDCIANSAPA